MDAVTNDKELICVGYHLPEIDFRDFADRIGEDKIIFKKRVIFEEANFQKINFGRVEFRENVHFSKAKFNGIVRFLEAIFDGKVYFSRTVFMGEAEFLGTVFNGMAIFSRAVFNEGANFSRTTFNKKAYFLGTIFKRDVDFSRTTFKGDVDFLGVTFKNLTKFINVFFELAKFLHCIFEDITVFKRRETFSPDKNEVVIFNFVNFKNPQNTTFMDFPLSKISFLMTDVKDITIIARAEEILSEKLLRYKEKEEWGKINEINKNENFEKVIKILRPYLRQETVLAEYRNIRKSFEKNRTFVEASELFIKEMELLKKGLPWYEKAVYDFYYGLSKYGESIIRPIFWSVVFIFVYPLTVSPNMH
ncbi:pentapeptide repeat-containing protein [Methanotorris formicicus]|uniref:pentapeptide repeat-containing protein n=1 Tax=Methanotorris formicicus TaxID=213185 RepID=UPI00064F98E6|nr:pentapeptide repeat-containing protein [Methanotorris formicicus]